jgi:rod shape-determining protein MreD
MKKRIFIFLIIILAVIFQASIFSVFFSAKNISDLLLIFVVSSVAVFGFQSIWIWVIISGIILDLFSFRIVGTNVISFMLFSYAVSFFSRRLILGEKTGGILISGIFVMAVTFFQNSWIQLANFNFELKRVWEVLAFSGWSLVFKAVLNIILFLILILLFKKMKKRSLQNKNLFIGN